MKKKLKLDVEALSVQQFEVEPATVADRGTVRGHYVSDADTDPCRFCPDMPITYSCEACG